MTYQLPTDTAHVRIESRQYRLFNFDLGEGIRRSSLKIGALIVAPWLVLMFILGISVVAGFGPFIWFAPPAVATWLAVSRDESGRVRLRSWLDRVGYLLTPGSRTIINADTTPPGADRPIVAAAEFIIIDTAAMREGKAA